MGNEEMFWTGDAAFAMWCIAFVAGLALFAAGIYVFFLKKNFRRRIEVAAVLEMSAYWILYIPYEFCNEFDGENVALRAVHSALITLLKTFTKYLGDGYERIYYPGRPVFSMFYGGLIACVNIVMLLFMARYIIKFVDGPVQRFKLLSNRNATLYVFSEYNAKTASIAASIERGKGSGIVFVSSKEQLSEEQKHKIEELDGILIFDTLDAAVKSLEKLTKEMEVFVFNASEQENLSDLGRLADVLNNMQIPAKVYVELSETPWDLYNGIIKDPDHSKVTVNLVRVEETYVYNNLLHHSIFANAVDDGKGSKIIKILIAGINERNIEMLKAVLHLSQMPFYRPEIIVIDEEDRRGYLSKLMPEVKDEYDEVGDAIYKLEYHGGVRCGSEEFEALLEEKSKDFTFAFVNIGDDLQNINTALALKAFCRKDSRNSGYKIQAVVRDASACSLWDEVLIRDIQITGMDCDVYSHDFITMSDIDSLSREIHEVRQEDNLRKAEAKAKEKGEPCTYTKTPWEKYCNNEYDRHSVFARTLSFRYKVRYLVETGKDLSETKKTEPWLIYEHMRWDMYTRTLGYTCAKGELKAKLDELNSKIEKEKDQKVKDGLKEQRRQLRVSAMVHEDLVIYDDLTDGIKSYDGLTLTEGIRDAFEKSVIID